MILILLLRLVYLNDEKIFSYHNDSHTKSLDVRSSEITVFSLQPLIVLI